MSYKRVIPRDFFNEAKLLNCLGKFEIAVVDKTCGDLEIITALQPTTGFEIEQDQSDGSLSVANYHVNIKVNGEWQLLKLFTPYNSREKFPLMARLGDVDYYIFDDNGKWMPNFGGKE